MSFTGAIRSAFRNYATFTGRASRPEFWWFLLFVLLATVALSFVDAAIFGIDPETGEARSILTAVFQLAVLLPYLAVAWRRMHDSGRPGWYLLLPLAVSIGMTLFIFLGVFTFGSIEYLGADPETLSGPAALLGMTGLMVAGLLQLVLFVLMIYWLTRPSDPGPNAYGPPPRRVAA